jgi:hypothetical protein
VPLHDEVAEAWRPNGVMSSTAQTLLRSSAARAVVKELRQIRSPSRRKTLIPNHSERSKSERSRRRRVASSRVGVMQMREPVDVVRELYPAVAAVTAT